MVLKLSDSMTRIAHHIDGTSVEMYAVDANSAVARHPDEWRHEPWSHEDAAAARKRLHARRVKEAEEAGRPAPEAPVEPEMTDAERAEFEEWRRQRDEAAAVLKKHEDREAEKAAEAQKVEQARAAVAAPPPRPDPARRRPFGRTGEPTAAEKALLEKRAAAKAEADKGENS